jgi:hypothetical protein
LFADIIPGISTADGLFIITALLVFITAWLTYLTRQNVSAAKNNVDATNKLIELQTEPFVFIGARLESILRASRVSVGWSSPPEAELLVFIQNRGGGPARNINFVEVTDDFPAGHFVNFVNGGLMGHSFKETSIVKEGIKELAPGQEIPLAWLLRAQVSGLNSVKVVFTYENSLGKSKPGSNVLDFPSYRDSALPIY